VKESISLWNHLHKISTPEFFCPAPRNPELERENIFQVFSKKMRQKLKHTDFPPELVTPNKAVL
jgi:hypothetical protein